MKTGIGCILFLLLSMAFVSCQKNSVSKIPIISLMVFWPADSMTVNIDTTYVEFALTDGDGDIGNSATSVIYYRDSRYATDSFLTAPFPDIDPTIEDPKKGLQGTCVFYPVPQPVPRSDTFHAHRDTLSYELYITDRAGHQSNHITTHQVIIKSP